MKAGSASDLDGGMQRMYDKCQRVPVNRMTKETSTRT